MPVPDGAESLASATEETTLTQILRNNPEYSFKLREAQTIILNNRAITPPEDTPYQRQFVRRRSRSRLPYRPRQRQQKEAVPQQLDAIENSSPVVDTQQIESIPRYGSAGTDFSSENSVDDTLENQIKLERSQSPEDVPNCTCTRLGDSACFEEKKLESTCQNSHGTGSKNTPTSDAASSSCVENKPRNERGSENENIELLNPIPLQFYENHRRDHVCENCVMRPSSLIRAAFNLRVTPRHIMQIYSLPNNPWAPPSLVKINQKANFVTYEGAPQAWDLTFLDLMPHQINLSLETLRQICGYNPEHSAFSVVQRTAAELFQQELMNILT